MKPKVFLSNALLFLTMTWILVGCFGSSEEVDDRLTDPPIINESSSTTDENSSPTIDDPLQAIDQAPLAVVSTRSLRVRAEPGTDGEVIFAVKERESYDVLGISADGKYIQLAIPKAPGGKGWVDANFVTMQGDITNIERGAVSISSLPTPTEEGSDPLAGDLLAGDRSEATIPAEGIPATVQTNGQRLRVRKGPNAESPIAGRVENGEQVTIVETTEDGTWGKIAPTGKDNLDGGWVAMEFLVTE